MSLSEDVRFIVERALWETENLIVCIPNELWNKRYDAIPMWKYLYHTLHSMDRWFINPNDQTYREPYFHTKDLGNLNVIPDNEKLSKEQLQEYFFHIKEKIHDYVAALTDEELTEQPECCGMSHFLLILGQLRHWHRHMGIIYGFIIEDTGKWPYVLNMSGEYPNTPMPNYYE